VGAVRPDVGWVWCRGCGSVRVRVGLGLGLGLEMGMEMEVGSGRDEARRQMGSWLERALTERMDRCYSCTSETLYEATMTTVAIARPMPWREETTNQAAAATMSISDGGYRQ
jgi:hypothetical protein